MWSPWVQAHSLAWLRAVATSTLAISLLGGCGSSVDNTAQSCRYNEDCCSRGRGYWCKDYACEPARPALDGFPSSLQRLIEDCEQRPTCGTGLLGYVGCPCDTVVPGASASVDVGALAHEACTTEESCLAAGLAMVPSFLKRATVPACVVQSACSRLAKNPTDCCAEPDTCEKQRYCSVVGAGAAFPEILQALGIGSRYRSDQAPPHGEGPLTAAFLRQELANGRPVFVLMSYARLYHFSLVTAYSADGKFHFIHAKGTFDADFETLVAPASLGLDGQATAAYHMLAAPSRCWY